MQYFIITPKNKEVINLGSLLITEGIKYLLPKNVSIVNVSMYYHEQEPWKQMKNGDYLIFAGNPRLNWDENCRHYWDYEIFEYIMNVIERGVKYIDAWAGGSYYLTEPLTPIEIAADNILKLDRVKIILEVLRNAYKVITRDSLMSLICDKVKISYKEIPCSSWFAGNNFGITGQEKKLNILVPHRAVEILPYPEDFQIICTNILDYKHFSEKGYQCNIITSIEEILQLYSNVDRVISYRVHTTIPALSLGAKVCNIYHDYRYLTVEKFNIPSFPYNRSINKYEFFNSNIKIDKDTTRTLLI